MLAKTTTHRQHHWLMHVKAADVSHGTMAEYAATHTISLKSLYQWKTKLIRLKLYVPDLSSPKSDFVSVSGSTTLSTKPTVRAEPADRTGCTVTLSNGTRIDFHGEQSAGLIRSIMSAVGQPHWPDLLQTARWISTRFLRSFLYSVTMHARLLSWFAGTVTAFYC